MKKRWRYYIDRRFQNQFILKFSFIILLNMLLTLSVVWLVREKSYSLLPNGASVLVQVDSAKAIPISIRNEEISIDEEEGRLYFPLKTLEGEPPKLFNAFDLYFVPILFVSLLNLIIVGFFSLFFSHKMAGPLYRIKLTLETYILRKTAPPIVLRKGDFFQDLAHQINRALDLKEKDKNK
jgi:hypothetical protein